MGDSCPLINLLYLFQLAICVVLVIMVPSQEVVWEGYSVLTHEVFTDQEGPPYLV